jgi:hypothetical protein
MTPSESLSVFSHLADCFDCREMVDELVGERPFFLIKLPQPAKTSDKNVKRIESALLNHVYKSQIGRRLVQIIQQTQQI